MPIQITPEVFQREIDRFAHLLVEGDTMPLLMLAIDRPSGSMRVITGPVLLTRMRESEIVQETVLTTMRDSLGRQIMGPMWREGGTE